MSLLLLVPVVAIVPIEDDWTVEWTENDWSLNGNKI